MSAAVVEKGAVSEGLELCKKIVNVIIKRFGIDTSLYDDLLGAAQLGLAEAIKRYDSSRGVDFLSFAALRIRGSCLDYLRTCTHLGPKGYKLAKALKLFQEYQEQTYSKGIQASDLICMGALTWKITVEKDELERKPTEESDPDAELEKKEVTKIIKEIVKTLPKLYRDIYSACYEGDMSFADFARGRRVTKASISKAHKRMLEIIRSKLYEAGYFN